MPPNNNTSSSTETLLANAYSRFAQVDLHGLPWSQLMTALLILAVCTWLYLPTSEGVPAPFAGHRLPWEPSLLSRLRFAREAPDIINEGHCKVLPPAPKSPKSGSSANAHCPRSGRTQCIRFHDLTATWSSYRENMWMNYRIFLPSN